MNSTIVQKQVKLVNELGLHARAAAMFVKHAGRFKSDIKICKNGMEVDGKSIMGILMLAMPKGDEFHIKANGEDANDAVDSLCKLISNKFGENH